MKITAVSDLHGYFPRLIGGDLLIVAGDLTACDTDIQHYQFCEWLDAAPYRKKIVIAGNHDNNIQRNMIDKLDRCLYLEDEGCEFEGLKIWGTPWILWFHGINPHCKAFTGTEAHLKKKFDLIPHDTDILICHGPPFGILDKIYEWGDKDKPKLTGSKELLAKIMEVKPKLVIFGHIHEHGNRRGHFADFSENYYIDFNNVSIVNERYEAVNKPTEIRFDNDFRII